MGANDKKKPTRKKPEPLNKSQKKYLGECGEALDDALALLEAAGTVSREFSIVRTKLEEAEMWLTRAFDELGYAIEGDEEDDEEDDGEGDEEDGGPEDEPGEDG